MTTPSSPSVQPDGPTDQLLYHVQVTSDRDRMVHAEWIGPAGSATMALRAALTDRQARVPDDVAAAAPPAAVESLPPPSRLVYFEDVQPGMVVQRFFREPDPAALHIAVLTGGGHRQVDEWATVLERRERADVVSLIVVRPNGDQEWMYGSSLSALRVRADR